MKTRSLFIFSLFVLGLLFTTACRDPEMGEQGNTAVRGCTNPNAANYNPDATLDDNSCIEVQPVQNSLLVKFTGTWCYACGSHGAPMFESLMANHKGRVLAMTLQITDLLTTPQNEPLVNAFKLHMPATGGLSTPSFGVNNKLFEQNVSAINNEINTKYASQPTVALGMKYTIGAGNNAGKLNMNIVGKFFKDVTGDFNITIVGIAKKIIAGQKVGEDWVDEFEHKQVLLGAITTGGLYGENVFSGAAKEGDTFVWSRAVVVPSAWDLPNTEFGVIIWKKGSGDKYTFENCTISRY